MSLQKDYENYLMHYGIKGMEWGKKTASAIKQVDSSATASNRRKKLAIKSQNFRNVPMTRQKFTRSEESKANRKKVLDKNAANVADSIRKRDPNPQLTAKENAEIGNKAKKEVEDNKVLQVMLDDDLRRGMAERLASYGKTAKKVEKAKHIKNQDAHLANRIDELLARKKKRENNKNMNVYQSIGRALRGN